MFKLNIECSQDIEELNIKFKNGQTVTAKSADSEPAIESSVSDQREQPAQPRKERKERKALHEYLDVSADSAGSEIKPQHVPEKPVIPERTRAPSIAPELMRLDI